MQMSTQLISGSLIQARGSEIEGHSFQFKAFYLSLPQARHHHGGHAQDDGHRGWEQEQKSGQAWKRHQSQEEEGGRR